MQAAQVGVMRQVQNLKRGRADAYGASTSMGWQYHIEGAMGEMAVAKAFNLYWNGNLGNLSAGDVGDIQVRTSSRTNGDLIMHPRDRDKDRFILVTGGNGDYNLRGWVLGSEGKLQEYWRDPAGGRPAYFVPQGKLRNFFTFLKEVKP
jgi:hypothetical protein